ncbi:MAG TPA: hypothetical protein PLI71_09940 [Clostridia bacterium]|nr:hypothetical protein [Clostridia bacterium]
MNNFKNYILRRGLLPLWNSLIPYGDRKFWREYLQWYRWGELLSFLYLLPQRMRRGVLSLMRRRAEAGVSNNPFRPIGRMMEFTPNGLGIYSLLPYLPCGINLEQIRETGNSLEKKGREKYPLPVSNNKW